MLSSLQASLMILHPAKFIFKGRSMRLLLPFAHSSCVFPMSLFHMGDVGSVWNIASIRPQ